MLYRTVDGWKSFDGRVGAEAGLDYVATEGKLTFAAGETNKTVEVGVLDDTLDEGTEILGLALDHPKGARFERRVATGYILDEGDALGV